jgi:undecaprenyl-diphosphatase
VARWWSALGWDGRWALAALAACLLLGAFVMLAGGTNPVDASVQEAASGHPGLAEAGGWASYLLPRTVQLLLLAALVLLGLAGEWAAVLAIVAVFALADAPTSGLKLLFARERPPGASLRSFAYPSGHATGASSQWGFLLLVSIPRLFGAERPSRRMVAAWVLLGGLGALARVAEGEHWLTDVIGGFLWGAALCLAVSRLSRLPHARWRRRAAEAPPARPPAEA